MNANWIILIIGLAGGALPSWWVTSNYYQKVIAKEHEAQQQVVIEQQEQHKQDLIDYAERIIKAEVQRDKNARTIVDLRVKLDKLLVDLPTCSVPDTSGTGTNNNGGAGILYETANRAFRELQEGDNIDFERCDSLNADAIRANSQ